MILNDQKALDVLLTGLTHVLPMGEGEAFIYYQNGGRAEMSLPDGTRRTGVWRIIADGYHVDWQGGPSADWRLDIEPGRIAYLDAGGVERGIVSRIVPGDAAGLAA